MRQGLQVPATSRVRPTKRVEKNQQSLQTCGSSPARTSAVNCKPISKLGRISPPMSQPAGTRDKARQTGVSRGKAITRVFPRRRRETGDLQFVKHYFSESGNSFAQFSLSDLKARWEGEWLKLTACEKEWVSDRFENTFADLNQKDGEIISSDHLHNSGHITWNTPSLSPGDTRVVLNWDSRKGAATIPLISLFLWLIILDIICVLRIDFFYTLVPL